MPKKKATKQPLIRSKSAKLMAGILLLVVLAVGAVVATALVKEPQDTNTQAWEAGERPLKTQVQDRDQEQVRLTGDFDQDGDVDEDDANFLRKHFFQSDREARRADLNGDGRVNFLDYTLLRQQMGQ